MGRVCREVQEWVEEEVERPIEEWEERQEERCREEPCNWWMLCLNKLVCWVVTVVVKVVRWVVVTVGKWVTRVVCEVVNFVLDVVGFVVGLVLSIPVIGGIIRTVLNWLTEIVWRLVGVLDFVASLAGLRLRKKMYVGLIIPEQAGAPISTEAAIMPQIQAARALYDTQCNINLIYTGACTTEVPAADGALVFSCDASGFFSDWWLEGSFFELASTLCKFTDSWRRVTGFGAELLAFVANNVLPDGGGTNTVGCSMGPTHNYVVIEAGVNQSTLAHEIGHACGLPHDGGAGNLMNGNGIPASPTLTDLQVAVVRNSRHCVFI